ncbi:MAG: hypothetical protein ACRC6M_15710 [Microcystaceae cyanobacterium]
MTIVVTLSSELETLLCHKAAQSGQDVSLLVSELLTNVLALEEQDSQEAIAGIRQGLEDFETGKFRSFEDFADQQCHQYELSILE